MAIEAARRRVLFQAKHQAWSKTMRKCLRNWGRETASRPPPHGMLAAAAAGRACVADRAQPFAALLRELRTRSGLTQEELAEIARRSPRQISDLERGVVTTPQRETVRLLADALELAGPARVEFEASARGRLAAGRVTSDAAQVMRTLPRDAPSFTGRARELAELAETVAPADGLVRVHAVGGMAGIGKTTFAVHIAHQLSHRFPGGQIFLPLHAHTPGRAPVSVEDALATLLLATGVPAARIPADPEARTQVWRDRLADRPLLLVLDDAASSDQVRPLIPGAGGSLVLITSRRRLTALEEARTSTLDALAEDEAAELLVTLAGRRDLNSADAAVRELGRLCGGLPLAIGMLARQLHHHPAWTAADRVSELATAAGRLEALATENLSVAAAFDLSYDELGSEGQLLFRRLGLHPGLDIDMHAAAALNGTTVPEAARGLAVLYDYYLLSEPSRGRYRMHDLIRAHAAALARRLDPPADRSSAAGRLSDYYQQMATRMDSLLARRARRSPDSGLDGAPFAMPPLADRWQALEWGRTERASLIACLDMAIAAGHHQMVITLTAGLAGLLRYDGPWDEAISRHLTAVGSARQLGHRQAEATSLTDLGDVRQLSGDYDAAARDLSEAISISRQIGDGPGQAGALTIRGIVQRLTGNHPAAVCDLQEALALCRDSGDQPGQARVLLILGDEWRLAGNHEAAIRDLQTGMMICREIGDRIGEAGAVSNLSEIRRLTGDYAAAIRDLTEALAICRDIGHRLGQANVHANLGHVRGLTGDHQAALADLDAALGLYRELGDPLGQARTLRYLGEIHLLCQSPAAAAECLPEALALHRELGSRPGQAETLTYLAMMRRSTSDYDGAAGDLREALGICRDIGNDYLAITALNESGTLARMRGDASGARSRHQRAMDLARRYGHVLEQAQAEAGLGRCDLADGDLAGGERRLRAALAIFRRIGVIHARDLAAELGALRPPRI